MRPLILFLAAGVLLSAPITVPQIYSWVLYPGDKAYQSQATQIEWPHTLTRDKAGVNHFGIDPSALAITIMIDGKKIGTTGTLNLVSGNGVVLTAIDNPDAMTIQVSVDRKP